MAILIPSKIKSDNLIIKTFLNYLINELDNFSSVIQNYPQKNIFLILTEDGCPILVNCQPDLTDVDLENMEISYNDMTYDLDTQVDEIYSHLHKDNLSIPSTLVYFSPSLEEIIPSLKEVGTRPEIIFKNNAQDVLLSIEAKTHKRDAEKYNRDKIQNIIRTINPAFNTTIPPNTDSVIHQPKEELRTEKKRTGLGKIPTPEPIKISKNAKTRIKYTSDILERSLESIARNRPIFASGVETNTSFVMANDNLLPAILISASEFWGPVVVKNDGKGGFDIKLKKNPKALLGFEVQDISTSTPLSLLLPITHMFRSCIVEKEIILDDMVETFARWVSKYNLEDTQIDDIDIKIALKSIE